VDRRPGHHQRTPDAVIEAVPVTLETKTAVATENAILAGIRTGRHQSRRIVVDARIGDLQQTIARAGLGHALRQYGRHLDEIVIILGDDSGLGWWSAGEPGSV